MYHQRVERHIPDLVEHSLSSESVDWAGMTRRPGAYPTRRRHHWNSSNTRLMD
jgi:hypothetical protein